MGEGLFPSPGGGLGEGGLHCLGVRAAPSLTLDEKHSCCLPQFSLSCPLTLRLLSRHSPFRQHKTKDKHEIDRMTLTMVSVGRLGGVHGGHGGPGVSCAYLGRGLSVLTELGPLILTLASCPRGSPSLCCQNRHAFWGE